MNDPITEIYQHQILENTSNNVSNQDAEDVKKVTYLQGLPINIFNILVRTKIVLQAGDYYILDNDLSLSKSYTFVLRDTRDFNKIFRIQADTIDEFFILNYSRKKMKGGQLYCVLDPGEGKQYIYLYDQPKETLNMIWDYFQNKVKEAKNVLKSLENKEDLKLDV